MADHIIESGGWSGPDEDGVCHRALQGLDLFIWELGGEWWFQVEEGGNALALVRDCHTADAAAMGAQGWAHGYLFARRTDGRIPTAGAPGGGGGDRPPQ